MKAKLAACPIMFLLALAACTSAPADASLPPAAFSLDIGGFTLHMDQDIEEVFAAMGEPLASFEAPSCAFEGVDRIFSYPGLQIHTYPTDGGADHVHTVSVRDDSVLIYGGLYLGRSLDDVVAVYGDGYERDVNMYTYRDGSVSISFLVEDGKVAAITYGLDLG